jgi:ribosome-associated translation inhibitor RaiA
METPLRPQIELNDLSPEVKSYIYQAIMEFEPFTTENTVVAVVAKNPLHLLSQEDTPEVFDRKKLSKMYRISITLSEDGTKVSEEGLHEDIYEAIRMAKDKLVKTLTEIQDSVISNQDRTIQIRTAMGGGSVH